MSLEEFAKSLDLPFDGKIQGNEYVIEVDTSDDFSTIFNLISVNKDFSQEGKQIATENETQFTYTDGFYNILLKANYDKDIYKVIIEEK